MTSVIEFNVEALSEALPLYETKLIKASDDIEAIRSWLNSHKRSQDTFNAYRKEADRFLQWLKHIGVTLRTATKENIEEYRLFLEKPPASWICARADGDKNKRPPKYARSSPLWRPFYGPLSDASIRQAETIIHGLYRYLADANYLRGNPFALIEKIDKPEISEERTVSREQISIIFDAIEHMKTVGFRGNDHPTKVLHKARCRWLIALAFLAMPRISEIARMKMNDFHQKMNRKTKSPVWFLKIFGKGRKTKTIPVTTELMAELALYRGSLGNGLADYPSANDDTPALRRIEKAQKGNADFMSRSAVSRLFKQVMEATIEYCISIEDFDNAKYFENVSVHWMRHGGATNLIEQGMPITRVKGMMRHATINSTEIYVHNDDFTLSEELENLQTLPK